MFDAVATARVVVPRDAVVRDVGERLRIPVRPCGVLCEPLPVCDESASLTALVTAVFALAAVGTGFSGAPVVALLFCGASAVLRLWNQSQSVN